MEMVTKVLDNPCNISEQPRRSIAIDFIRGIAILMVFLVHYGQMFGNPIITRFGQMGCQMFFVASGFTCSSAFNRSNGIGRYYHKRLISLLPGLYTIIIFVVLGNVLCLKLFQRYLVCNNVEPLSILCCILLINGILPFCQNSVYPGGWFVGTLMICYVFHPLIDKLYNHGKRYECLKTVIVIVLMSVSTFFLNLCINGTIEVRNNSFEYFLFTNQIGCYLTGICLYYIQDKAQSLKKGIYFFLSIITLLVSVFLFYCEVPIRYVLCPPFVGLFTAFLYQSIIGIEDRNKIVSTICRAGRSSFYIFLTHWFVVWILDGVAVKVLHKIGVNSVAIMFIIVLIPALIITTFLSWVLKKVVIVEKKILKI